MRIAWATDVNGNGNAYGFASGNYWGRKCLRMAGVALDPAAPVALHHCPPHAFRPIEEKCNVLWTAWEFPTLPEWESRTLDCADLVCVTAKFLLDVFRAHTDAPVRYAPQGIDTETCFPKFTAAPRRYSAKRPFRCLWVGAPNDRKGYQFLIGAWRAFIRQPDMELYLKTTVTDRLTREGNVIFDSRDLPRADMGGLYRSADCFAFPTMAEGFGFTLGEAMASGLPCIYTPCTSLHDLAHARVAIPIKARLGGNFKLLSPDRTRETTVEAAEPDVRDLALKILWVKEHPAEAYRIGRKAAAHIRKNFTWKLAGEKLRKILETSIPRQKRKPPACRQAGGRPWLQA